MNLTEYERSGRALYSEFAAVIASILRASLATDENIGLQLVAHRAKDVPSLTKKLQNRQIDKTEALEDEIKDLAGCRVVLYTNSDVERFARSRIVHDNFEVLEVKVHEPGIRINSANELYQSNHFIVALKGNRTALAEYARFKGLRCEIQVQTILNHSWAQMAHDTIYKSPNLDGIGQRALEAVEARLSKVMTKYLLPAGYEFDKINADFARIIQGKELFDGKALDAIANSKDNNERADAIESFATSVLPLYDDIRTEYRDILGVLMQAVKAARDTEATPRKSYFGSLPAIKAVDIAEAAAAIIVRYRYVNIGMTFEALLDLFATSRDDEERTTFRKVGERLADHVLEAWEHVGPAVQIELVDRITGLDPGYARAVAPLLVAMLAEVLKSEVSGTTSDSRSVIFHTGTVNMSPELLDMRHRASETLKTIFMETNTEAEQRAVIAAMAEAGRTPYRSNYPNSLAAEAARATADLLRFQRDHSHEMHYQLLESLEERALRNYRTYLQLPKSFTDDDDVKAAAADVVQAAIEFRDEINDDPEFVIFKTLVGFESVFPPAWDDEKFQWAEREAYRTEKAELFVSEVVDDTAGEWFDRLSRFAATESRDLATFPTFGSFLSRLGEKKPKIVIDYLQKMDAELGLFAHRMIDGIMRGGDSEALDLINDWIDAGTNLGMIARYLSHADPFDPLLLERVTNKSIQLEDPATLRQVVAAAERQFRSGSKEVLGSAFLPALSFFYEREDLRWVSQFVPWLQSPIIEALEENDARAMLNALVPFPELQHDAEYLVAGIAKRWPGAVIGYLEARLAYDASLTEAKSDVRHQYQPLPFSMHQLRTPLSAQPDILLESARKWFADAPQLFRFRGGHLVATTFHGAEEHLMPALSKYVQTGEPDDAEFALDILNSLEGAAGVFDQVREIVANFGVNSDVHRAAYAALRSAGVLSGEFGTAEMLEQRKNVVESWLGDEREPVRLFAAEFIRRVDLSIASDRRSARARIAQRRLEHGEEPGTLDDDEAD